jgi:type III pantothenate kinase
METKEIQSVSELDEQFAFVCNNFSFKIEEIEAVVIASVVPRIDVIFENYFKENNVNYNFIDYSTSIGIDIKIDNPSELGSDLLVGAYQAAYKYGAPCIVVDMGTATTLSLVSPNKDFLGGVIYPGVLSSFNNLVKDTSKLTNVSVETPASVIGKSTTECLQSGMLYASSEAVNGLIKLIKEESGLSDIKVIITGGIASFLHPYINSSIYDENLLLDGLYNIYVNFIRKQYNKY